VYFRILSWFFFILPAVTAIFWGILVTSNAPELGEGEVVSYLHEHTVGGIGIILIAISIALCILAFVKIRWNNWRFKRTHMVMLSTSWFILVAF
jgi:quinol-cytochrome oxidoreductase complex cytochrome b subunit